MKAAAAVTLEEQNWMRQQGRRLKTLRGDVSFLRFPLNSDQVLVLSLMHTMQCHQRQASPSESHISGGGGEEHDRLRGGGRT